MDRPETWIVTPKYGPRPAGKSDECFYCRAKMGEPHDLDCVIRKRTVMVRFSITIPVSVPQSWDDRDINFQYNLGTWCAGNLFRMLGRFQNKLGCICQITSAEYVQEATQEWDALVK